MDLQFRNVVTILVLAGLIGGSGLAIVYEAVKDSAVSLGDSQVFNIFLGAILGYGGAIITFLYAMPNKPVAKKTTK